MVGGFSTLHPDIIKFHILTRLDGTSLAAVSCCSATLRHLSSSPDLWSEICHSTWPSTASPLLSRLITGADARAFFSQAYPIVTSGGALSSPSLSALVFAVDIRYKGTLIFSKAQETETSSDWFRCSPFRVDMLEPKDVVPTQMRRVGCGDMVAGMTLSWVVADPVGRRAADLSSYSPVEARRHWLTGEVQVRYALILAGDHDRGGHVRCGIVVTCGEGEGGGGEMMMMQVREVSLEMEDMVGKRLNGKDSLVFLQGALEGERGTGKYRVWEGQRRYGEYEDMRRQRRDRKLRTEGALDFLCLAFGISIFLSFLLLGLVQTIFCLKNGKGRNGNYAFFFRGEEN